MSSGTSIIQEALMGIGAHSVAAPASPEAILIGQTTLNSMLQILLSQCVDMGIVPLKNPGDELGEPLDARQAIIDNLSILLAPKFDNGGHVVVSQTLRDNARLGKAEIKRLYRKKRILNKVVSSTLPRGAGNTLTGHYWSRTFFNKGEALDSSDS